jgi:hypothetical protein
MLAFDLSLLNKEVPLNVLKALTWIISVRSLHVFLLSKIARRYST